MFTDGRYTSNEWIEPIIQDAMPLLEGFPADVATEVASAALKSVDAGPPEIPWVTVFPSDNKSQVASKLLTVLREPDFSTPVYDPDTHLAVEQLRDILDRHDAFGLLGCHAAYHLVQAAAGKRDENFLTYQDKSRKWPQYSSEWPEHLVRQFGDEGYHEILTADDELATILGMIAAASQLQYQKRGDIIQPGESTSELIDRTLQFLNITAVDDFSEATRILELGLEDFRAAAYRIRGLTAPTQ